VTQTLRVAVTGKEVGFGIYETLAILGRERCLRRIDRAVPNLVPNAALGRMTSMLPAFRDDGWLPIGHHDATWEEITNRFEGLPGSRRFDLTKRLFELRDSLRKLGVVGYLLLDGSYISAKLDPKDFDILLVASAEIQALKEASPELTRLLNAERAEREGGYSLFFVPIDSTALELISSMWDLDKSGTPKGILKVAL
jgi:hypothetical protein